MPRVRPIQQARRAKTRDAVLVAASRLFARRGIEATSLDDIARAIGLTKGAIYSSFPNKRALVDALTEQYQVPVDFGPIWRTDRSLSDRLAEMGRGVAALRASISRETVLLDLEYRLDWLRNPSRREKERQRSLSQWDEASRQLAEANAAQGETSPLDPKEMMVAIALLTAGVLRLSVEAPGALTDEGIENLFRLLGGTPTGAAPKRRNRSRRVKGRVVPVSR